MGKYDQPGLTLHPIELADDVGYAGWYSDAKGRIAGYRLYDGAFLPPSICPVCCLDNRPDCEACGGTKTPLTIDSRPRE